MAEQLRVIPDLLAQVGNELSNHAQWLLAWQMSCHSEAEDARSGWIGLSATALVGLLDTWATTSNAHTERLAVHAAGMHLAAEGFTELEQNNVAALTKVGENCCGKSSLER